MSFSLWLPVQSWAVMKPTALLTIIIIIIINVVGHSPYILAVARGKLCGIYCLLLYLQSAAGIKPRLSGLGNKHLYPLSHLASPNVYYF